MIINAYDESEEIVKAEIFTEGLKKLPDTAIVCYKKELIDYISKEPSYEEYSTTPVCGDDIKLYKAMHNGKEIIVYRTLPGAPMTVAIMEELASRGIKNFIFFGSCGSLVKNVESGAFILPTAAYRDEGTSYHYLPASDFVEVETAEKLAEIFNRNNIKYIKTKTWTIDALYKETKNKAKDKVKKGCQVVEMECSAIMAASKNRGFNSYQFLYSDDTLANEKWNVNELRNDNSFILKECLKIAFKIVENI